MVVMVAWEAAPLGKGRLLKTTVHLVKAAMKKASVNAKDVAMIVHSGVYRQHFRTEPAFATHIQGALDIKCTTLNQTSSHCFAFDVSDGSCSPHVALDAISDLLPQLPGKYAILSSGDERPNKQTEWLHEPYCFVAIVALEGDGPCLKRIRSDDAELSLDRVTKTHFDSGKKANISQEYGSFIPLEMKESGNLFSGDQTWLSGRNMHEFHQWLHGKEGSFVHRIIDRTGKSTSAHWER